MESASDTISKYKIIYEVGEFLFESTQEGRDSADAIRRFEARVGFKVISCKRI